MTWFFVILLGILALPLTIELMRTPMSARRQERAPGQFADLPQGRTHFDWLGPEDGPMAVCVHGLTTPSFVWHGVGQQMAEMGYHVLIYDHFGRGFSDTVRGRQDADFFVKHLEDLLEHEHVDEPVTVIGYSMGGAVAAHYTAAHPEAVERLILIASAGMRIKASRILEFCRDVPVFGDWLFLICYPLQLRKEIKAEADLHDNVKNITDLQTAETDRRGFFPSVLSSYRGVLRYPAEKQHKAIASAGIPVLAIWGDRDDLIPKTAIKTLVSWNKASRHSLIVEAGHGLPYTHTKTVMRAIGKFVA